MASGELSTMSLMPLETPVLKVSRPVAACSRCRNAKIKCDGKLPACSSCEKNGRADECTSTNDQFARGKERSYVSTLETRLDKLQAKLEEVQARKPSVVPPEDDDNNVASSRRQSVAATQLPSLGASRSFQRREVSAIDDLVSDFGFLSVNATARDFYGFTSAMSYSRLILSACTKDELPSDTAQALPPRYLAMVLTQHYFNTIFVLLPMFDEASFYASLENVYSKDFRKADPLDHWMVRMVLAIACASISSRRGDERCMEGIGHVCAALNQTEAVLHPGKISGIQALILLAEYAVLDPHHFDSWSLIGAASRAMTDLGLHQDPPKGTPMTKFKLEIRRRVFHTIYALDRATSLVQSRAFSFSDDSAKVKIPFSKQPSSAPGSPQASQTSPPSWLHTNAMALELIHFRQIQSKWYTDLFQSGRERWEDPYTYLWNTCNTMRKWFESLSPATPTNMLAFFELELLNSYIYILSPSPRVPSIHLFAQMLIFEYAIRYAELMLQLINDSTHSTPLTFYDAMRVYMIGRQFLDVLQHSSELLLNGSVPAHPEVKPSAASPPAMPTPPLPLGESLLRFNLIRSISCINNITACLAQFGVRWGYMSWNQRYQNETAGMMGQLTQKLREHDDLSGLPRQSMWPAAETDVYSEHSATYALNPSRQPVSQGPMTSISPPQSVGPFPQFTNTAIPPMAAPTPALYPSPTQQYDQAGNRWHPEPLNYSEQQPRPFQQQQQQQPYPFPQSQPSFSFASQPSVIAHAPISQSAAGRGHQLFDSWSGYTGFARQESFDDEEDAVAPEAKPWNFGGKG